jgi:hypothetical protein
MGFLGRKVQHVNHLIRLISLIKWCLGPESNWHAQKARDFKSLASTNFATEALVLPLEEA